MYKQGTLAHLRHGTIEQTLAFHLSRARVHQQKLKMALENEKNANLRWQRRVGSAMRKHMNYCWICERSWLHSAFHVIRNLPKQKSRSLLQCLRLQDFQSLKEHFSFGSLGRMFEIFNLRSLQVIQLVKVLQQIIITMYVCARRANAQSVGCRQKTDEPLIVVALGKGNDKVVPSSPWS